MGTAQLAGDELNSAIEQPIFLVGAERSGTTLLRLMLNHHPMLAFHFESEFILKPLVEDKNALPVGAQLRSYQDWLRSNSAFKSSGFLIDESLSYKELVRSFLRQKLVVSGKPMVGMTIHYWFDNLPRLWPNARYIHLIRDGRDVANSAVHMGWYGNAWAATERWKHAIATYENLKSIVPSKNIVDIRFEQLMDNSRGVLTKICEFLGIRFDEAMFDYAETSSYSIPSSKIAKSWRNSNEEFMTRVVEAEIGVLLQRLGYEPSGFDQIEITDEIRRKLQRENYSAKRRWRIQRYGFWNMALNKVAEALHIAFIRSHIQTRMSEIDRKNIK